MKLEFHDVSCGYAKDHPILSHVDLEVSTGEICCLLGPNGVGKTTLFKTCLKLLKPLAGEVRIDGQSIAHWSYSKLASHLAYVSQFHVPPFPYVVQDVILLGRMNSVGYFGQPKPRDYDIVNNVLHEMGIEHLREKIYTDISGGERQLVMIARALAQEPKMLVLDEPTASLDYGNMVRVLARVKELSRLGYGIIMTTHNPDHCFVAESKVALLRRGQPVIFGQAEQVVTSKNLHEAYGVDVNIKEFVDEQGRRIRLCAPVF